MSRDEVVIHINPHAMTFSDALIFVGSFRGCREDAPKPFTLVQPSTYIELTGKFYHAFTKAMHAAAFSAVNAPVRVASLASGIIPARFKR